MMTVKVKWNRNVNHTIRLEMFEFYIGDLFSQILAAQQHIRKR